MNTKGKSILIVEDDNKIRNLIKIYLEKAGYDTFEARDGEETMEAFKKYDPSFVLSDEAS